MVDADDEITKSCLLPPLFPLLLSFFFLLSEWWLSRSGWFSSRSGLIQCLFQLSGDCLGLVWFSAISFFLSECDCPGPIWFSASRLRIPLGGVDFGKKKTFRPQGRVTYHMQLKNYCCVYIPREENRKAHLLANRARIDQFVFSDFKYLLFSDIAN